MQTRVIRNNLKTVKIIRFNEYKINKINRSTQICNSQCSMEIKDFIIISYFFYLWNYKLIEKTKIENAKE